jgi:hypothetical protein
MKKIKQADIKVRLENRIISNFYTWRKRKTRRDRVIKTGDVWQYVWRKVGLSGYRTIEDDGTLTVIKKSTIFGWRLMRREIKTRAKTLRLKKFRIRGCKRYLGNQNSMRSLWLD